MMLEKSYTHTYDCTYGCGDSNGRVRPAVLADFLQDAANAHASHLGLAQPGSHILWFMTRMRLTFIGPIFADQPITVKTWCRGVKGPSWLRDFSLTRPDGQLLGQAATHWALWDAKQQTILRPSYLGDPDIYTLTDQPPAPSPERLRLNDPQPCHHHLVCYSDLDRNQHMNNAKLLDVIGDALSLHLYPDAYLADLQVYYKTQCRFQEELCLEKEEPQPGAFLLRGRTQEEIKLEACARLAPLYP